MHLVPLTSAAIGIPGTDRDHDLVHSRNLAEDWIVSRTEGDGHPSGDGHPMSAMAVDHPLDFR